MSAASIVQSSGPVSAFATLPPSHSSAMTAVQSGPYTKTQFQHTMEGSRTIKSSKEVEQLLRDYPAALELYRTGKYKVKVKCDAEVERVILVEKRVTKSATNDNQENNQTVPDISKDADQMEKEVKKEEVERHSRSRTQSQDRVAPSVPINGNTLVPTTMSSIRMTSNTQPKVDHHRTPSRDRDASTTPSQKTREHKRSQSRDNHYQGTFGKQQGKQSSREQQNMMLPYVPNANHPAQLWQQQQQRPMQSYYSNPLLQQQQQQQQQQQKPVPPTRGNVYMQPSFVPQQNQLYRQPFYYGQRPTAPVPFPLQTGYPLPPPTARSIGKASLYSTNNYSSSRSVTNTMVLPPSFRTFHAHQQPVRPFHPIYQPQIGCPWFNPAANEPISALVNPTVAPVEQRGARNRARSVDVGPRNQSVPARPALVQQRVVPVSEHRSRQRVQPVHVAAPARAEEKDPNVSFKEPASSGNVEKLTVRQLNETFTQANPSGRVPYNSLPEIIQRFGIQLTENDVLNAAKQLEYNVNDPISARRFVHILVKLGKITKSTQPQAARQPVSPSTLPEDREVKDIMTQQKITTTHVSASNQPNQWN